MTRRAVFAGTTCALALLVSLMVTMSAFGQSAITFVDSDLEDAVREAIEQHEIEDPLWCPDFNQVADGLTKTRADRAPLRRLAAGRLVVHGATEASAPVPL